MTSRTGCPAGQQDPTSMALVTSVTAMAQGSPPGPEDPWWEQPLGPSGRPRHGSSPPPGSPASRLVSPRAASGMRDGQRGWGAPHGLPSTPIPVCMRPVLGSHCGLAVPGSLPVAPARADSGVQLLPLAVCTRTPGAVTTFVHVDLPWPSPSAQLGQPLEPAPAIPAAPSLPVSRRTVSGPQP